MHEENGMAKKYWRTLTIIKDVLFMDSSFPINVWAEAIDTSSYLQNRLSM